MKKIFIYIFLIMSLNFFVIVKAKEYKLDNNGNYYVKEAVCMYKMKDKDYKDYKFEIHFKNAKISAVFEYRKDKIYEYDSEKVFKDLTYKEFFANKQFSCFKTLYIDVFGVSSVPIDGTPNIAKNSDIIISHPDFKEASWISEESYISYEEAKEGEKTENKNASLICHYTKQTLNSAGSNNQAKAPQSIDYIKYSDNTMDLVDSNNKKYTLASGSKKINKCDINNNLQMFIKVVDDKYKIVDSCSDNNGDCIIYVLSAYNGQGTAGLKPDGTSPSDTQLADPSEVPEVPDIEPELPNITECSLLLGKPEDPGTPAFYLLTAFHIIKYVALVLMIVLSVMDFTGAIAQQDKDVMAKILKKLMKRFILCIIIFLLPYLLDILLNYLVERQTDLCGLN